jgi:ribose/xylose/arabinose/galactoside ABC-type transport system permease subunit
VLLVVIVGFALLDPLFVSAPNWVDIGRVYYIELAFMAVSATIVLISRGIDLSVAAVFALTAVTIGVLVVDHHVNIWLAMIAGLLVGTAAGLLNGALIAYVGLTPIVATLGTLTLYRGIALGITDGRNLGGFPTSFTRLGQGTFWGIPTQAWVFAVVVAIVALVLGRTVAGRWIYAMGGNPEAARLAGIPVRHMTLFVYSSASLLAAMGGVVAASRFNTSRSDFATAGELDAITAAILGGVSITGGRGSVLGAVVGALIIAVLRNGLTLHGVSGFVQIVVIGLILVGAAVVDRVRVARRTAQQVSMQLEQSSDAEGSSTIRPAVSATRGAGLAEPPS